MKSTALSSLWLYIIHYPFEYIYIHIDVIFCAETRIYDIRFGGKKWQFLYYLLFFLFSLFHTDTHTHTHINICHLYILNLHNLAVTLFMGTEKYNWTYREDKINKTSANKISLIQGLWERGGETERKEWILTETARERRGRAGKKWSEREFTEPKLSCQSFNNW